MKYFLLISLLVCFLENCATVASAANFRLSFATEYTFAENGSASVKKTVKLSNLTTNTYPSVYYLDLPIDAESVVAFDNVGKTETTVTQEGEQKRVKIILNHEALGIGNEAVIALSYNTNTLAFQKNGKWNVAIPGFSSGEEIESFTVSVSLPGEWGEPSRVTPPPDKNSVYYWTLTERSGAPITFDFTPLPTPTFAPPPANSKILPLVAGLSVGIIAFAIIFESAKKFL